MILPFPSQRLTGASAVLDQLHVLVTGVGAAIARDVVRLLVSEGATVVAADEDPGKLARLERDLALYRIKVETAVVELGSQAQVGIWEMSQSARGKLPHLMVCCCGSPACRPGAGATSAGRTPLAGPADIGLGDHRNAGCPGQIAQRVLQPTLFLHAEPLRRSAFDRALAVLRHPTLRGVLERAPGRGVFSPAGVIPYVRIASHVYSLFRDLDEPPAPSRRLRLVAPVESAGEPANAA